MRVRWPLGLCMLLLSVALLLTDQSPVAGCPFCTPQQLTFSERIARDDVVLLAQWVSARRLKKEQPASTTFEVTQILKGAGDELKKGKQIVLGRFRVGKVGNLFLLRGTRQTDVDWDAPIEITETAFQYIAQAPSTETPSTKRLAYYLKFLEFSDPLIANDAFAEFAAEPFKNLVPLKEKLPRAKIRKWIADPNISPGRLGFYGMLLGMCGQPNDVAFMEKKIFESTDEFQFGIDGVMAGYLILSGSKGLDKIDKKIIANKSGPATDSYAFMQALRFMWSYGNGRIENERLKRSMRLLLDKPDLTELVIRDLGRWKDWSIQNRLMELFNSDSFNDSEIKRGVNIAIIRYMMVSAKAAPADAKLAIPQHAAQAKKNLEILKKRDPKTFQFAERFAF